MSIQPTIDFLVSINFCLNKTVTLTPIYMYSYKLGHR